LDLENYNNYRRISFDKHVIAIPADDLLLNRRDTANRSDREMTLDVMFRKTRQIRRTKTSG